MSNQQKQLYKQAEESKTACIRAILGTLKDFITCANDQKFKKKSLDYSRPFQRIEEIISTHNNYGILSRILKHINMKRTKNSNEETESIKEIALLNKVGEILNLSDGIVEEMSIQGEKDSIMKLIRPKILSLLELFKDTFCQTKEEE